MLKRIIKFFDKLEDSVRAYLSRRPILYTLIGGVAVVLFWRGVWHTADLFPFLTGPVSTLISVAVLLVTGLFVSYFIGDTIIISGLKREKKISDKTETEIKVVSEELIAIKKELDEMRDILVEKEPKDKQI